MTQNKMALEKNMTDMVDDIAGELYAPSSTPRLDWMLSATVLYSVMFFFLTLSFKGFFYFAPFDNHYDVMPLLLTIYVIAWPMLIVVPPLLVLRRNLEGGLWTRWSSTFFLLGTLTWPVVVLIIKFRSLAVGGVFSVGYWGTYPIFIFLEIIWPIANVVVWFIQVRRESPEYQFKREIRERAREEMRARMSNRAPGYTTR